MRLALLSALTATAALSCSLAACSPPAEKVEAPPAAAVGVQAADAWCRPSPKGARVGACYLTLTAGQTDRFTGFTTPAAATPQIHTMSTEGGMMQMRQLTEGLALPAGEAVALKPGAEHLMLIDLAQPLVEGAQVTLALMFETAPALTVQAVVRAPAVDGEHGAREHGAGHG